MSKILVVAAHPDDEALGCGATMARHAAAGDDVAVVILGEGVTSRKDIAPAKQKALLRELHARAEKACKTLGVKKLTLEKLPDNSFDSVPLLRVTQAVEKAVAAWMPETVYTHWAEDLNVDHRITCEAVKTATRPMAGGSVKRILSFEVPSATEWRFGSRAFHPNVFLDAAGFLEKKLAALRCYAPEMRSFPHPRSEEYIRSLAAVRGGQSGLRAAEAFELIREIR